LYEVKIEIDNLEVRFESSDQNCDPERKNKEKAERKEKELKANISQEKKAEKSSDIVETKGGKRNLIVKAKVESEPLFSTKVYVPSVLFSCSQVERMIGLHNSIIVCKIFRGVCDMLGTEEAHDSSKKNSLVP